MKRTGQYFELVCHSKANDGLRSKLKIGKMKYFLLNLGNLGNAPEDCPELSTEAGLHQHVEELPVLERLEQLHDELAVRLLHDLFL